MFEISFLNIVRPATVLGAVLSQAFDCMRVPRVRYAVYVVKDSNVLLEERQF